MATINKPSDNKCWWGCGEKGTLVQCWQEYKLVYSLWETIRSFLKKKKKIELPYYPAVSLLGIYSKKWSLSWKDTCTAMFIAILFIITEAGKQLKCPSVDKEGMINEYKWNIIQLAITIKEILPFTATCMDLEGTIPSKTSICQKKTNTVWFHLHVETKKELNSLKQSRMVIAIG